VALSATRRTRVAGRHHSPAAVAPPPDPGGARPVRHRPLLRHAPPPPRAPRGPRKSPPPAARRCLRRGLRRGGADLRARTQRFVRPGPPGSRRLGWRPSLITPVLDPESRTLARSNFSQHPRPRGWWPRSPPAWGSTASDVGPGLAPGPAGQRRGPTCPRSRAGRDADGLPAQWPGGCSIRPNRTTWGWADRRPRMRPAHSRRQEPGSEPLDWRQQQLRRNEAVAEGSPAASRPAACWRR